MELLVYSILVVVTLLSPNVNGRVVEYSSTNQSGVMRGQHVGDASIMHASCQCTDGTCVKNDEGVEVCKCLPEYGPLIRKDYPVTKCMKCHCGKGINCSYEYNPRGLDTQICVCKEGFSSVDNRCKADCSGTPCKNGGRCIVRGDNIECICSDAFEGDSCQIIPCDLAGGSCKNGGKCFVATSTNKFCKCLEGTSGHKCEVVRGCTEKSCGGGVNAKCFYNQRTYEADCECENTDETFDFSKNMCRTPCDSQNISFCVNWARCLSDRKHKFCSCQEGTSGDRCEIVDQCKEDPEFCGRKGGAICVYDYVNAEATCICKGDGEEFDGSDKTCKTPCDPSAVDACGNGAKCEGGGEDKFCYCLEGTSGDKCEVVEVCNENPDFCGEGGNVECVYDQRNLKADCKCDNAEEKFDSLKKACRKDECKAKCGDGYEAAGITCTPDSNDYEIVTCSCNDRTKLFDNYTKSCIEDKCKAMCGEDYAAARITCNPNSSNPSTVRCSCNDQAKLFDYDTKTCINPCTLYICNNGGVCLLDRETEKPKCNCDAPYFGDHCEKDPCTINPCHNGGECSIDKTGRPKCACIESYFGDKCEKDPCTRNQCKNGGKCSFDKSSGKAKCLCMEPYFGDNCEIDPCTINPCHNGGECFWDKTGKAKCHCTEPYFGDNCEIDPCTRNPCKNGGECLFDKSTGRAKCLCTEPYFGDNCEIEHDKNKKSVVITLSPSVILGILLMIVILLLLCVGFCNIRMNQKFKAVLNSVPGVR